MSDIKNIISQAGIDSVTRLTSELEKSYLAIQDNIVAAKTLNDILARTQSMAKFTKSVDDNAMSQEKLRKAVAAAQLQEERLAAFRENEAKKQIQRDNWLSNEVDKGNRRVKEAIGSYKQLSAQYNLVALSAQNLGAKIQQINNEIGPKTPAQIRLIRILGGAFDRTSEEAKKLHNQLLEIDKRVGKNGRNVGNYPTGFNGLSNSIQQLTREFPAFTFSIQTGLLALSNNIPIFFDQIRQTRAEIKLLQSQGKPTQSLFSQIASSIFSFGTALSIGVTLLTVYGKEIGEFVKAIFKGSEAMDGFALRQKTLNEASKSADYTGAIKNVNELSINIGLAKEGFISKEKVLNQYNETIGKTTGEVNNLDQAERELGKNANAFIQMTLLKAAAQIALDEAAKKAYESEISRRKKLEEFSNSFLDASVTNVRSEDQYRSQQANIIENRKRRQREEIKLSENARDQQLAIAKQFQAQAAKISKDMGFDFFGDKFSNKSKKTKVDTSEFDYQKALLEGVTKTAKAIVDSDKNSLSERLLALETFQSASQDLINNDAQKQIKIAKGNADKIKTIRVDQQNKFDELETETSLRRIKLSEDAEKELVKVFKDGIQEQEKLGKSASAKKALQLAEQQKQNSKDADAQLKSLAEQYAKGEITQEEYGQRRLFAIKEINDQAADLEIKGLQEIIDIRKSFGIDTTSDEERLADIKKKYASDAADFEISQLEKVGEAEKALREKRKEFAREAFNFAIDLVNSSFERQSDAVDREMDLNENRKNTEIENVNESILTQQQKEEQIKIIEAQSEQRKIALEQRQRDIEVRKAKFQKAAAIAEIAISTATAVAKISAQAAILFSNPFTAALGGLALAQIPYIIGIGALQAAAVLAQPIPKFAKGGTMSKDGLAEYGHGTELRIDPDGRTSITSSTPEIGWVQKGTKFISAPETKQLLAKPDKHDFAGKSWDVSGIIASQDRNAKEIKKALGGLTIKNKRTQRNLDMQSWNGYLKRNGF